MTTRLEFRPEDNVKTSTSWTSSRAALWAIRLLVVLVLFTVTCTPIAVFILVQTLDQSVPQTISVPSSQYPDLDKEEDSTDVNSSSHIIPTPRTSPTTKSMYLIPHKANSTFPSPNGTSNSSNSSNMAGSCKPSYVFRPNYGCVASCPIDHEQTRYVLVLKTLFYISAAIQYLCISTVFYTWAKVKDLRTLAHTTTVLTAAAHSVGAVMFSVPLLAGRGNVMCSSDDVITHNENGPTNFCLIQGAMLHFSVLCASLFFSSSVFNVTVAVLTFATDNVVKRHARVVFVIECFAAVVVPGSLVGYTAGMSGYIDDMSMGDLSTFTCYISDGNDYFFTFVAPLQIVCVSTTTMAVLIIRRVKQSIALRRSLLSTNDRASIARVALMKRFVVIAMMVPFASVVIFTACSFFAIPSVNEQLLEDANRYTVCQTVSPDSGENTQSCSFTALMGGYALCQALKPIVFAVIGILLLVYSLIPSPARQFWASNFKKVRQMFCRGKDKEEGVPHEDRPAPLPV